MNLFVHNKIPVHKIKIFYLGTWAKHFKSTQFIIFACEKLFLFKTQNLEKVKD